MRYCYNHCHKHDTNLQLLPSSCLSQLIGEVTKSQTADTDSKMVSSSYPCTVLIVCRDELTIILKSCTEIPTCQILQILQSLSKAIALSHQICLVELFERFHWTIQIWQSIAEPCASHLAIINLHQLEIYILHTHNSGRDLFRLVLANTCLLCFKLPSVRFLG